MIKVASWNVNSLKVRLDQVLAWMNAEAIDVLALQETKVTDEQFPLDAFSNLGLYVSYSGQKTYNGMAIITRQPMNDVMTDIPGFEDAQRRILAATVGGLRIIDLYVPNGGEIDSDKYQYKLAWLQHVSQFIHAQAKQYPKLVVLGDFNIAPEDRDVHDPLEWQNCTLVSQPERDALALMMSCGLSDSFRKFEQPQDTFSWWDYRAAGFRRNRGLRIDLILLSEVLTNQCAASYIDVEPRRNERPSDHAPVVVDIL